MAQPLEGLRGLQSTLARIIAAPSPEKVKKALTAGAEIVAEEARRLVPELTGNLRDSIIVSTRQIGFGPTLGANTVAVYVGPSGDGYYGFMIEFGTIHMTAQPWLTPAYENTKREVTSVVGKALWLDIRAAAKG